MFDFQKRKTYTYSRTEDVRHHNMIRGIHNCMLYHSEFYETLDVDPMARHFLFPPLASLCQDIIYWQNYTVKDRVGYLLV